MIEDTRTKETRMATYADEGDSSPQLTARELRTRKAFVGLDLAAIRTFEQLAVAIANAHLHQTAKASEAAAWAIHQSSHRGF
jgi:hypothetical protein